MSAVPASRQGLRVEEGQIRDTQRFCVALSAGTARSLGNMQFAVPAAVEPTPPRPAEERLAAAFRQAMEVITLPEWSGFVSDSVDTVTNEPIRFGEAALKGTYQYIEGEIAALAELGQGFVKWLGEVGRCVRDVGFNTFDPDAILKSDACEPFHDTAILVLQLKDLIAELKALGLMGVLELLGQFIEYAAEILLDVLTAGLTALGERAEAIKTWLIETAKSVSRLGELIGTLLGTLLMELGTSGVGRAIKSVRVVDKLPDLELLAPAAIIRGPVHLGPVDSGFRGSPQIHDASVVAIRSRGIVRRELDELTDVIQKILNQKGKKFSKNLTTAKLRIVRKHLGSERFKAFVSNRKVLERYFHASVQRMTGRVGSYKKIKEEVREFNRRVLTFNYSEALAGDVLPDEVGILAQKYSTLPRIFEANHIVEQRVFVARKAAWSREFELLGWNSVDEMDAILLTAADHTGSVRAMLRRLMPNRTESEILELAPDLPNSVTTSLKNKIRLVEDLAPGQVLAEGTLVVDANTKFAALIAKYAEIYSREAPEAWKKSLRGTFHGWIDKLGYADLVLPD